MANDWTTIISTINSKTVRLILFQIENDWPLSTRNGLLEGEREKNGVPTEQLSGFKHDSFVFAVQHCATWILMHGALPATRQKFNKRYSANDLRHCVERWLRCSPRFKNADIQIPAMAWIVAAKMLGLEASCDNYPYYKISNHAINRGSYFIMPEPTDQYCHRQWLHLSLQPE